jgi:uncharacterized protein YigA (DUF484 family)
VPDPVANDSEVADFLRANPRFLADNPELYVHLEPPLRLHGEALADHMAAQLRAARAAAAACAARAEDVLAAGRAASGLAQRVQEAVLLLLGTGDVAECVSAEFPVALAVDAARLCAEGVLPGWASLPAGAVAAMLGARPVLCRSFAAPDPALHGAAARLAVHEAIVRIPGDGPPALLALATREADLLGGGPGNGALAFLGRALAVALRRSC